jgi:hypothetical protein
MFNQEETDMTNLNQDDGSKRVKRIAAVLYLLVMAFVVGGSYVNQHQGNVDVSASAMDKD